MKKKKDSAKKNREKERKRPPFNSAGDLLEHLETVHLRCLLRLAAGDAPVSDALRRRVAELRRILLEESDLYASDVRAEDARAMLEVVLQAGERAPVTVDEAKGRLRTIARTFGAAVPGVGGDTLRSRT